jgi:hypothetical protein
MECIHHTGVFCRAVHISLALIPVDCRYKTIFADTKTVLQSKGKAVPLEAWSGPEGSRKLRFPDFMTTAQDGGKVVSFTHRPPLPPGNFC